MLDSLLLLNSSKSVQNDMVLAFMSILRGYVKVSLNSINEGEDFKLRINFRNLPELFL